MCSEWSLASIDERVAISFFKISHVKMKWIKSWSKTTYRQIASRCQNLARKFGWRADSLLLFQVWIRWLSQRKQPTSKWWRVTWARRQRKDMWSALSCFTFKSLRAILEISWHLLFKSEAAHSRWTLSDRAAEGINLLQTNSHGVKCPHQLYRSAFFLSLSLFLLGFAVDPSWAALLPSGGPNVNMCSKSF